MMALEAQKIIGLILLASCIWLYMVPYRQYRTDLLRYRLFSMRDELFRYAADGRLPFDAPAYGMTRNTLNGMLRFAHEITLTRLLLTAVLRKWFDKDGFLSRYRKQYSKALGALSEEQRDLVISIHTRTHLAILAHVAFTSPALVWVTAPAWVLLRVLHRAEAVLRPLVEQRRVKRHLTTLDAEANFMGCEGRLAC